MVAHNDLVYEMCRNCERNTALNTEKVGRELKQQQQNKPCIFYTRVLPAGLSFLKIIIFKYKQSKFKIMWTIIIVVFISICVANYLEFKHGIWSCFIDYIAVSFLGLLIGGLIGFAIAIILPAKMEVNVYSDKIENLQDNSSVSGSFFLGCGNIEGKMKYVYYYENNGAYKMRQLDYENVSIKYSNTNPKVEQYKTEPVKNAFINNFALDFISEYFIIYVPKGTIKSNYSLDAL